jgi:hypothetical protein
MLAGAGPDGGPLVRRGHVLAVCRRLPSSDHRRGRAGPRPCGGRRGRAGTAGSGSSRPGSHPRGASAIGRNSSKPMRRSPPRPRQSDLGHAREIAGEHQRPAHECSRDPGRLRHRVDHDAGELSLPQLARQRHFTKPASSSVARQNRSPRMCSPRGAQPAPVASETAVIARSRSPTVRVGSAPAHGRRRRWSSSRRRSDPVAGRPRQNRGDRNLVRLTPPQEVGEDGHLPRAPARTRHLA